LDFKGFWDEGEFSQPYHEPPPGDELIAEVEAHFGLHLPGAHVEFARLHNGGAVRRSCHPMTEPTGWAHDHIAIPRPLRDPPHRLRTRSWVSRAHA
jgi:hypothetical protein